MLLLALTLGALASAARAGEARCWVDRGAVVVSAAAGDLAGDFILDLSAPKSLLHETKAEEAGLAAPEAPLPLRVAGERLGTVSFTVADLDARQWGFPTNIVGVIGADALAGRVLDLTLRPCRLTLWPGRPRPAPTGATLPIAWIDDIPTVAAAVADAHTARAGRFAIDTGSAGVRLASSAAALSRAPPAGADPASRTDPPARLAAVSLAGAVIQNAPAGLDPDAPPGVLGELGAAIWSGYRLRIDLRRNQLLLTCP